MKRSQAQKLYDYCQNIDENGNEYYVIYNASPYVAEAQSGTIEHTADGKFIYSDSAVCDIDVEECDIEDFDVYLKFEDWTEGDRN